VELGALYVHPSGLFEIIQPQDWEIASEDDEPASANWNGPSSVMHAFASRQSEPVNHDQLAAFVQDEFVNGLSSYDDYTVISRDYGSDPVVVDFEAVFEGVNYTVREWAGAEDDLIWVLRVVVPASNLAQLDFFGENILPTFRVYPGAVSVSSGWVTYRDDALGYLFQHPPEWVSHGTIDGARRFVDAEVEWQIEMDIAVLSGAAVASEEDAEAILDDMVPGAVVSGVESSPHGLDGYSASFAYPAVSDTARRGVLLVLNANDALYRVELRLPPGADDPVNAEAQARAQTALQVLDTFTPLLLDAPISAPEE
jgi:hypothetical protein